MPCYDDPRHHLTGFNEGRNENAALIKRLEDRADTNARVACEALSFIEKGVFKGKITDLSEETQSWWSAHKKFDKKRER